MSPKINGPSLVHILNFWWPYFYFIWAIKIRGMTGMNKSVMCRCIGRILLGLKKLKACKDFHLLVPHHRRGLRKVKDGGKDIFGKGQASEAHKVLMCQPYDIYCLADDSECLSMEWNAGLEDQRWGPETWHRGATFMTPNRWHWDAGGRSLGKATSEPGRRRRGHISPERFMGRGSAGDGWGWCHNI